MPPVSYGCEVARCAIHWILALRARMTEEGVSSYDIVSNRGELCGSLAQRELAQKDNRRDGLTELAKSPLLPLEGIFCASQEILGEETDQRVENIRYEFTPCPHIIHPLPHILVANSVGFSIGELLKTGRTLCALRLLALSECRLLRLPLCKTTLQYSSTGNRYLKKPEQITFPLCHKQSPGLWEDDWILRRKPAK
jgi:hypothetical protein